MAEAYPNNQIPGRDLIPRMRVVEEARKMLGVPYVHLGRNPYRALDCLGLLCCVADALGVSDHMPGYDFLDYVNSDYNRVENPEGLVGLLSKPLVQLENIEDKGIGDIEVYWIRHQRVPCHAAILTDVGHLHSLQRKEVVEQPRSNFWDKRLVTVFRFPGIEE
jgi:hypothetical protein